MESKKEEEKPLAGTRIEDPRERLVNRVASCMIKEPNFTKGNTSDRVVELVQDLVEVLDVDPEFISQLAYYARNTLNLRSVSNFLIAYASQNELSREYLGPYFTGTVRLPTDLLQIVEFQMQISAATRGGSGKINTCLRKLVKKKFGEFNLYQMGKYCSEGRRKRAMKKAAAAKKLLCGEETKETKAKAKKLNMKQLVRLCHIQEPAETVMSILGKHYPSS